MGGREGGQDRGWGEKRGNGEEKTDEIEILLTKSIG